MSKRQKKSNGHPPAVELATSLEWMFQQERPYLRHKVPQALSLMASYVTIGVYLASRILVPALGENSGAQPYAKRLGHQTPIHKLLPPH